PGTNPGARPVLVVDAHQKCRAVTLGVVPHHQIEAERVRAVLIDRDAEEPRRVFQEERDIVGVGVLRGHDQVTLVLPVGIVDDEHLPARGESGNGFGNARSGHWASPRRRSMSVQIVTMTFARLWHGDPEAVKRLRKFPIYLQIPSSGLLTRHKSQRHTAHADVQYMNWSTTFKPSPRRESPCPSKPMLS